MKSAVPEHRTARDALEYVPGEAFWVVDEFVRMPPSLAARLFPCALVVLCVLSLAYAAFVEVAVTAHGRGRVARGGEGDTVAIDVVGRLGISPESVGRPVELRGEAGGVVRGEIIGVHAGSGERPTPSFQARLTTPADAARLPDRQDVAITVVTRHVRLLAFLQERIQSRLGGPISARPPSP